MLKQSMNSQVMHA